MVQLLALVERTALQTRLQGFLSRNIIRGVTAAGLPTLTPFSIREIARRTGFARTTLQDFLTDPTKARPATVARIESLLDNPRLRERSRGLRTEFVDAPRFTQETIASIRPPPEATAARFIGSELASPGREMGSTPWIDISDFEDFAASLGDALDNIERIVFDVG